MCWAEVKAEARRRAAGRKIGWPSSVRAILRSLLLERPARERKAPE